MNLKECFRYQKFLDRLIANAGESIDNRSHCLHTVKTHMCSKANADVEDFDEDVTTEEEFFMNDDLLKFMVFLVFQEEKLSTAISEAKRAAENDIDVAVAINKSTQSVVWYITRMLANKPSNRIETAIGHKFNVEGNQVDYKYDVKVSSTDAYDRELAKRVMKYMNSSADERSTGVDKVRIETEVDYDPPFDINDSFEDAVNTFLTKYLNESFEEVIRTL